MLPFQLHLVTEEALQNICTEQWSETQTLDFKAIPPKNDADGKREFCKDISAFANADGGDIIYGISDKAGNANALKGITDCTGDGLKRRLLQTLEAGVEPRVQGIQMESFPLTAGGFVFIVRIPASLDGPHRHGSDSGHRFVYRNQSLTSDMTYNQLREAFGARMTLTEKAAAFRTERVKKIMDGTVPVKICQGPLAVVHFVPLGGLAGRTNVDIASISYDHRALRLADDYGWLGRTNIDGLVMYPHDSEEVESYSHLFRDASFELVSHVGQQSEHRAEKVQYVIGSWVGNLLRQGLKTYNTAAPSLGVEGPIMMSLSIIHTSNTWIKNDLSRTQKKVVTENLQLTTDWIDNFNESTDIDKITKPIMDFLYQCYGLPSCNLFDARGAWKLS
ncbi:MAG: hypothetical protein JWM47_4425 [Acidimicrobiales bacterium]|nr:hypothetical protein [Acidimicrobiales bacterium]